MFKWRAILQLVDNGGVLIVNGVRTGLAAIT